MRPDDSVEWILNHILATCHALKVETEGESFHCLLPKHLQSDGNNINILLSEEAYRAGILTCLLQKAVLCDTHPVVYLFLTEGKTVDLSQILHQEMNQLHVVGIVPARTEIIAAEELVSASFLTHLSITGHIIIDKNVMAAISKAVREEKLQSLCFTGADVTSSFKDLFKGEATLLNGTHLTSLSISAEKNFFRPIRENCFDHSWVNLASLSVKDMTKRTFRQLSKAINQSRLVHLKELCLSVTQNEKCDLREIKPEKVPLLEHLCVQRCIASKRSS